MIPDLINDAWRKIIANFEKIITNVYVYVSNFVKWFEELDGLVMNVVKSPT